MAHRRLFLVVALACAACRPLGAALAYARHELLRGELWRLLTVQLAHASWSHLAWNLLALGLCLAVLGPGLARREVPWVLAVAGLGASLGVLAFHAEIGRMLGLSAALHGLYAAGAWRLCERRRAAGITLLATLAAKLALELLGEGSPAAALLEARLAGPAHLYGAVCGLLFALLLERERTSR